MSLIPTCPSSFVKINVQKIYAYKHYYLYMSIVYFITLTSVFSLDISVNMVSINSLKNSFGFLSAQAGLAMNNLRYTPPTTGSLVAMSILVCVSGNFNMALGFRLCKA